MLSGRTPFMLGFVHVLENNLSTTCKKWLQNLLKHIVRLPYSESLTQSMCSFPTAAVTNHHKLGQLQSTVSLSHSSVGQMFIYSTTVVGPGLRVSRGWNQRSWQGCLRFWSLWGRICFCSHSACWPNLVPCGWRTHVPLSLWLIKGQAWPVGASCTPLTLSQWPLPARPESLNLFKFLFCCISLTPTRESSLVLRTHHN